MEIPSRGRHRNLEVGDTITISNIVLPSGTETTKKEEFCYCKYGAQVVEVKEMKVRL